MNSTTKKITISAVVIVAFVAYAVEQYIKNSAATPTTNPISNPDVGTLNPNVAGTTTATQPAQPTGTTAAYKDGSYTGKVADAFYGSLQAQVTISGGKITNITYLKQPNDRAETIQIAARSLPLLRSEAITAQSAQVDVVSGATQNSQAFVQTVQSALDQAKA